MLDCELVEFSAEAKRFVRRYLEVFLVEVKYFIDIYNLQEILKNRGNVAYQVLKNDSGGTAQGDSKIKVREGKESANKAQSLSSILIGQKLKAA